MSPSQFHANRDTRSPGFCPPPLKINRSSHSIKKSSSLSSSSSSSPPLIGGNMGGSTAAKPPPQHRHPVIIYTHSPKVIHTHPRDFMALVQKLTGLSRPEDAAAAAANPSKPQSGNNSSSSPSAAEDNKMMMMNNRNNSNNNNNNNSDDNESSSVITDEFGSSSCNFGDGQVNSRGVHHPNLCNLTNNVPVFASNSADFYGSSSINNQPTFYGYNDSFLFSGMRTHHVPSSSSSSSSAAMLEGLNEFRDY